MSPLEQLRSEAAALEVSAAASGSPIQHCAALEQIAKRHGYENWRACRAILNAVESPASEIPSELQVKRYQSTRWGFGLDIPQRWNAFPAVPTNSPYEVIRFASREQGNHLLIVFREPCDPEVSPDQLLATMQERLGQGGFGNFAAGETAIGTFAARTLDFDKDGSEGLWSCRHYIVAADTLRYVLGFGTNRRDAMSALFERMARSFTFEPLAWNQAD